MTNEVSSAGDSTTLLSSGGAGIDLIDWENGLRRRLYHLRIHTPRPHRTVRGWVELLRKATGLEVSPTAVFRYEEIEPEQEGTAMPVRYIVAVAKATGTDPLWILGWNTDPNAAEHGSRLFRRGKGRPTARKSYKK